MSAIGHGAQATCVIVQLRTAAPSTVALEAAMAIAHALKAEMESLFVEDSDLMSLACLPCAREVSLTGRRSGVMTLQRLEQDMRLASSAIRRQMERMASLAGIPFRFGIVHDDPETAIAAHCRKGTLLALADPLTASDGARLALLMERMSELAGFVFAGPHARRRTGPIIATVEDVAHLQPLLAMAERLVSPVRDRIVLLLLGDSDAERRELQQQSLSLLRAKAETSVAEVRAVLADPSIVADVLRRLGGSFLLAQSGGMLAPERSALMRFMTAIDCPVLLLR